MATEWLPPSRSCSFESRQAGRPRSAELRPRWRLRPCTGSGAAPGRPSGGGRGAAAARVAQRREEARIEVGGEPPHPLEGLAASGRDQHDVTTAVDRVASPLDKSPGLDSSRSPTSCPSCRSRAPARSRPASRGRPRRAERGSRAVWAEPRLLVGSERVVLGRRAEALQEEERRRDQLVGKPL